MTLDHARRAAQKTANEHGIIMAVGYQTNDTTGENEFGYCPLSKVGPAFVHTVLERVEPSK